ncbi:hypothetical protein BGX27_010825 [Mortierella sp. AM989]|nr:hypothetical protein BGX27_010825 [Mortierella sp. AM989]
MDVTLRTRACTVEKKTTVSNQIVQANLATSFNSATSDKRALGFSNFLTRKILQMHKELIIEISIQTEVSLDMEMAAFWNCPSTSDTVILISGEDPVYIHKKFVLESIPKIQEIIHKPSAHVSKTLEVLPAPVSHNFRANTNPISRPSDYADTLEKRKVSSELAAAAKSTNEDTKGIQGSVVSASQDVAAENSHSKSQRMDSNNSGYTQTTRGENEMAIVGGYSETEKNCTESSILVAPKTEETSYGINPSEILQPNLANTPYTLVPAPVLSSMIAREGREVWLWPPQLPRNSCIDVMRWVYLKRLSPEFNLGAFHPFMELLAGLEQWHHFQENALRGQGYVISPRNLHSVLRETGFRHGYTNTLLRAGLMKSIEWNHNNMLKEHYAELLKQDKTGTIQEFLNTLN